MKKEDSKKNQNPVINPPDIAIALAYDGESAPKVLAKGQGNVADKIIEMAEENDIPLQTDSALSELLCHVPTGEEIPESLYLAVAKVLAFTYMLTGNFDKIPKKKNNQP
ncbi:MAG: hypothetical protein HOM11_11645 [Methylococcales bacterium]|mgnify:CR=1 FL=1|jgi:flagellar biosynthesis protein|nr:hypothetical protein [Methylococcales bacterium]MBT7443718.1 hypothetical protein [Methylococcales bacterium]